MLKIWGRTNSINVQKVMWTVAELGLAHERVNAGMAHGVVNEPWYADLNPNRLVPAIDDDGVVLWESNVIVRYLCQKHGMGTLCPRELDRRIDLERWMDWQQTTLRPRFHALFDALKETPASGAAALESLTKSMDDAWAILDAQLAKRPYIAGAELTMADIPFCYILNRWHRLPIQRRGFPNVTGWYERLCERPAFRRNVYDVG